MKTLVFSLAACAALTGLAQIRAGEGIANTTADNRTVQNVEFIQRGGGAEYGYRGYEMPLGLTFLPWAAPNFESTVKGIRFNFGWGRHAGVYGLDLGVFGRSGDFAGISADVFGNYTERDAAGIQMGLANVVEGTARGLQIGFVNYADRLEGVQIGILNFAATQWTLPLINIAW